MYMCSMRFHVFFLLKSFDSVLINDLFQGPVSPKCQKTSPKFCLTTDFAKCLRTVISYVSLCFSKPTNDRLC